MTIPMRPAWDYMICRTPPFDRKAMKKVTIPSDILPDIVPSGQIAGYYNKEVFVCNAIGDNQASFLGAVNDIEKSVLINIGTSSQVSIYTDQYVKNIMPGIKAIPWRRIYPCRFGPVRWVFSGDPEEFL